MTMSGLLLVPASLSMVRRGLATAGASSPRPDLHSAWLIIYAAACLFFLGIGLERRRRWAWDGAVYSSGFLALLVLSAPLIVLGQKNRRPMAIFIVALFLAAPILLFLRYLLRPSVRKAFEPEGVPTPDIWINLISAACVVCSGTYVATVLNPKPQLLCGFIENRLAIDLHAIVTTFLWLWIGLGLYRLKESARRWAIVFSVVEQAQFCIWMFLAPARHEKWVYYNLWWFVDIILWVAQTWYLVTRRHLFSPAPNNAAQ